MSEYVDSDAVERFGLFLSTEGIAMKDRGRMLADEPAIRAGKGDHWEAFAGGQEVAPRVWVKTYESRFGGEPLIVVTEGALLPYSPVRKGLKQFVRQVSKRSHGGRMTD